MQQLKILVVEDNKWRHQKFRELFADHSRFDLRIVPNWEEATLLITLDHLLFNISS